MVSPTVSSRLRLRTAASTWVESLRWVPHFLSKPSPLSCASIWSKIRVPAAWSSRRCRNAHSTLASNPPSSSGRCNANFQSRRVRTALTVLRSAKFSRYWKTSTMARVPACLRRDTGRRSQGRETAHRVFRQPGDRGCQVEGASPSMRPSPAAWDGAVAVSST